MLLYHISQTKKTHLASDFAVQKYFCLYLAEMIK